MSDFEQKSKERKSEEQKSERAKGEEWKSEERKSEFWTLPGGPLLPSDEDLAAILSIENTV